MKTERQTLILFGDVLGNVPPRTSCGPVVRNQPANAVNMALIPGLGRFYMPQGNKAHMQQLLKTLHPRAHALQQEQPPQ